MVMPDASKPVPHVEHYDNGEVKLRGAHLGGEMHGPWEFFRRDGSTMRAGAFDHGRQIGVWKTFDRNGGVVRESDFDAAGKK
jgi:antitoxin component YwqK of YwqJK toxin-antitoxin module